MRIKATLLMLLGLLALGQAQLKVTLTFESAAQREVFIASELPKSPPAGTIKVGGATYEYSMPSFGGNAKIYVWDRTTNNIASKAISEIKNGALAFKAADFTLVGQVTVHVEHKGLPVQAAKVSLTTKGKSEEKLLDPSGKGDVEFFGFPAGDLHVKVAYNATDKKEGSLEMIFSEPAKRDKPEPVLTVAISDDVATIAENAAGPGATSGSTPQGQQPPKPAEPAQRGNSVGIFILELLALALVLGFGFWVFHMARHNPKQFEATLQKLGVQVPSQDPNASAPIPVAPLPPAPPAPKIMLDDAEPTPLGAAVAVIPTPLTSPQEPTLVSESGNRITLVEGESLVGREDGLVVSLVGETTVSRRHASVLRSGTSVVLKDLGSTNGTFVNGTRLQGEATLKPGDQVQFGSVRFRYEA
ncbi:MAG: FHA domain-containing protein [Fimbriimonadales bacterium]